MMTGTWEGGVSYILTSVPQMPPTSILSKALSSVTSGMGKSRISVLLGPTLTAANTLSTAVPPDTSLHADVIPDHGRRRAFDLPPGANILDVRTHRLKGNLRYIGIILSVRIQVARRISDRSMNHA